MEKAQIEEYVIVADQQLKLVRKLRTKSMIVFDTPLGSEVRFDREKKKCRYGPFISSSYNG